MTTLHPEDFEIIFLSFNGKKGGKPNISTKNKPVFFQSYQYVNDQIGNQSRNAAMPSHQSQG
jgi:hypothetical protein